MAIHTEGSNQLSVVSVEKGMGNLSGLQAKTPLPHSQFGLQT